MSESENFNVRLDFFARPFPAIAYIFQIAFIGSLGIGSLILGLKELSIVILTPQMAGGLQWALWIIGFLLCVFVVFFDICILTQVSVENGILYERKKFINMPKAAFQIDELKEVTARKYYSRGRLFSIMSLDLRFKNTDLDKNEWIIELPISISKEEATLFASKINHLIQARARSEKNSNSR
jgi:hypothetical protein